MRYRLQQILSSEFDTALGQFLGPADVGYHRRAGAIGSKISISHSPQVINLSVNDAGSEQFAMFCRAPKQTLMEMLFCFTCGGARFI